MGSPPWQAVPICSFWHWSQCRVDNQALESIVAIKSLKRLSIKRSGLEPKQLPYLVKLRNIERIYFDVDDWPVQAKLELNKALAIGKPKPSLLPSGR